MSGPGMLCPPCGVQLSRRLTPWVVPLSIPCRDFSLRHTPPNPTTVISHKVACGSPKQHPLIPGRIFEWLKTSDGIDRRSEPNFRSVEYKRKNILGNAFRQLFGVALVPRIFSSTSIYECPDAPCYHYSFPLANVIGPKSL